MSTNRSASSLVFFGISDRGLQRENNEDHFIVADLGRKIIGVRDNQVTSDLIKHDIGALGTLLAVADGLGGHESGEVASLLAVDITAHTLFANATPALSLEECLLAAIDKAHTSICEHHSNGHEVRRMASTLTAVHVGPELLTIAQVGDSRAYRYGDGKLTLLTEDQTVVYMMQKRGLITEEEAQHHPHRNVILQALGQGKAISPVIQTLAWGNGDLLLLCSDGLSSYVSYDEIETILASEKDESICCQRLLDAANAAGAPDNVTILLARLQTNAARKAMAVVPVSVSSSEETLPKFLPSLATASVEIPLRLLQKITGLMESKPAEPPSTPASTSSAEVEPVVSAPQEKSRRFGFRLPTLRWLWGKKTEAAARPVLPREPSKTRKTSNKKSAEVPVWEPHVLRSLEENLAQYIGPVAKIVVMRAAGRTHDLNELCRILSMEVPTEQEKRRFLQAVQPR